MWSMSSFKKPYELQPKFKHDDKTVHPITYVAVFFIEYRDGSQVVIDIKGCPDSVDKQLNESYFGIGTRMWIIDG